MAEVRVANFTSFYPHQRRSFRPSLFSRHCASPSDCCHTVSSATHYSLGLPALPSVQTLRNFPRNGLKNKTVLLRFDSSILLAANDHNSSISTIHYLLSSGARVILVGDWGNRKTPNSPSEQSFAIRLSAILRRQVAVLSRFNSCEPAKLGFDLFLADNMCKFKDEIANSPQFAERLAMNVDIFVNDCFSSAHKILASTVGVTKFCYARLGGFHFEESLNSLNKATQISAPFTAVIIGGSNLLGKEAALLSIVSKCDTVVFVGLMCFQIMNSLGIKVPSSLINPAASGAASNIVDSARKRNVSIVYPIDFWCENERICIGAEDLSNETVPIELGPQSLLKIKSSLTKMRNITWISPVQFKSSQVNASAKLAEIIKEYSKNCDVTVAGEIPCAAMKGSSTNTISKVAVMWEHLNGRKLHGLLALDREYQYDVNWESSYFDPSRPLAVDIGSGNGMFALGMAKKNEDLNFLGLEMNTRLVNLCLDQVRETGSKNCYFIAANATSMFRSIVSSYPGDLILVSVQCPNPDFSNPENRWSMVQRSLVEAVTELLRDDGNVFLQSDVEAVALRMRDLFMKYGNQRLGSVRLDHNPYGVRSDWEMHILQKGNPMHRFLLSYASK